MNEPEDQLDRDHQRHLLTHAEREAAASIPGEVQLELGLVEEIPLAEQLEAWQRYAKMLEGQVSRGVREVFWRACFRR